MIKCTGRIVLNRFRRRNAECVEMNIKQIIDRLNVRFTGDTRKLVFWYDDNGEFVEDMQNVTLDNAKIHFLQPDNQFATSSFWSVRTPRPTI